MNAVVYSPQAQRQLADIWSWVETRSGFPERAEAFVDSIIEFCDNLADNPQVGIQRDDLRPGLRVVGFRRRVNVAFAVVARRVEILGVYYGGQDFESQLRGVMSSSTPPTD